MLVSALLLLFGLLFLIYKDRKIFIFSTVDAFVLYFVGVIVFTYFYHTFYPGDEKFNLFNFDRIKSIKFNKTLFVFIKMLLMFLIGVFLYSKINRNYTSRNKQSIRIIDLSKVKFDVELFSKVVLILLITGVFLVYLDYGAQLFYRAKYIPKENSTYKTIYQNLFIVVCILSGILYEKKKFLAITAFFLSLIIALSIGSRSATIYLLVFGLSHSFFLSPSKRRLFYMYFIPVIVVFFGYNISLRSEANGHGLIPYLKVTLDKPEIIFVYVLKNIYYTFIFGFYATCETLVVYKNASISNLITSLSPLPGRMTNWYGIASKMRLNVIAPYTAIGEISKYPIIMELYYIIVGFYFAVVDNFIKKQIAVKKYLFPIMHYLLLVLFIVHSFEYNLRSANRFIYYSLMVYFVFYSLHRITSRYRFKLS